MSLSVSCRVGTFGPIAGRRVDARTVECFAPYHVSGVVEISVNGAMGVALQYVAPAYVEDVVFDDSRAERRCTSRCLMDPS